MEGRVCPRCGYKRKPTDLVPDYECPSCGIIYDKFTSRSSNGSSQVEPDGPLPNQVMGGAPPKKSARTTILAAVLALLVVAGLAGGAWMVYFRGGGDTAKATAQKLMSFAYDIRGEWMGELTTEVRHSSGSVVTLVYHMKVVIGPEYQVDSLTFTDINSLTLEESPRVNQRRPEVSCEISWLRPDEAELSCECLDPVGSYTYPYLRLTRSYRWLSFYYKHQFGGEVSFEAEDLLSEGQADKMDQNGYFRYDRGTGSFKAVVNIDVTPRIDFTLHQDAVEIFRLPAARLHLQKGENVQRFFFKPSALPQFHGLLIKPPAGPQVFMNVKDPTDSAAFRREPYGNPPFYFLSNLNDAVIFDCRIEKKHRKVEIQFYPDGRKIARVLDRTDATDNMQMVFQMEKN